MDMSSVSGQVLGRRIRRLRTEKGFESIEAFGIALGYSWITVSRYERGVTTPTLARLQHIANVLDVPLSELLTEKAAA